MSDREFIIQRYSVALWPAIRGRIPFFGTGPRFHRLVNPKSLERYFEWRFPQTFRDVLKDFGTEPGWKADAAQFLLEEQIVTAQWSITHPDCAPPQEHWDRSIVALAREIPNGLPDVEVIEYLSGLGSLEHYQNILGTDGMRLEVLVPPLS